MSILKYSTATLMLSPLFMLSSQALAVTPDEEGWQAEVEVGLLIRTGNTESESWKGKLNLEREINMWRHQGEFDYYREETENLDGNSVVDADRIFASAQTNRKFEENSNSSLFMYGSYEDDRFSSYEYQSTLAAGYGNRYTWAEDLYADFEIGPGYSYSKRRDNDETEGEMIARLAGQINWNISDTSRFSQSLSTEVGSDNVRSRAVSTLTANINSALALRLSLTLNHNDTVYEQNDGRIPDKLDTETAVTVVYSF